VEAGPPGVRGLERGAISWKHFVGHMFKYAIFDIKPTHTVVKKPDPCYIFK